MFNTTVGGLDVAALTDAEIDEELERLERLQAAAGEHPDANYDDDGEDEEAGEERALTDQLDDEPQEAPSAASTVGFHGENAPPSFLDPISRELMRDPVMVGDCGQVYERDSIEAWFAKHDGTIPNDPLTGTPLASTEVRPVHALRNAIQEWMAMQAADTGIDCAPAGTDPKSSNAATPTLLAPVHVAALDTASRTSRSDRAQRTRQRQAQECQLRVIRAQRAEQRRRSSTIYRFRVASGRTAVSQQSIGLTLVTVVAGLFMCMVEYSNQKYPGAGASEWSDSWICELRSAQVECQEFGKGATGEFSMDSQRERCRTAFTIARRQSRTHSENQVVQLHAYRYPTAVFIDTAAEAEAFLAEVVGAANVRVGGAPEQAYAQAYARAVELNATVPCRCGTLLESQRCGRCECGEQCTGGQCRCVCPEPQQSEGQSDFACGCAAPHDDGVWTPCTDGHCQLGTAVGSDTEWDAVYETGLTGTARIGLLVLSLALVWAGFSCCAYSATLLDRNASIQLAIAVAAMVEEEQDQYAVDTTQENVGTFRADLAAAVSTTGSDDLHVVGTVAADGISVGGTRNEHKVTSGALVADDLASTTLATPRPGPSLDESCMCRRPDRDYSPSSCCCWSGLAYIFGIAGIACAQTGGGRWDWLGFGMAIGTGFVAVSMAALRLSWRPSS